MLGEKLIKNSDGIFISPIIGLGDRIFFSCKRLAVFSVYEDLHYQKGFFFFFFKQIFCASRLATLDDVKTQEKNEA